jgi:hypothetical protein
MFSRGVRRLIVLLLSIFTFFLFRDIRNHGVEYEHATDAEDQQSSPGRERGQDFKPVIWLHIHRFYQETFRSPPSMIKYPKHHGLENGLIATVWR